MECPACHAEVQVTGLAAVVGSMIVGTVAWAVLVVAIEPTATMTLFYFIVIQTVVSVIARLFFRASLVDRRDGKAPD
jgi:hypothetical protein